MVFYLNAIIRKFQRHKRSARPTSTIEGVPEGTEGAEQTMSNFHFCFLFCLSERLVIPTALPGAALCAGLVCGWPFRPSVLSS